MPSFASIRARSFTVLCAVASVAPTIASTIIPGGNVINQTWTPAGSPYIVQGDVTVPSGAFLTIQAGTVVQFTSTDSQLAGLDATRVELTVNGTLSVNGTLASPVAFLAQSGAAPSTWYGIVVGVGATSVTLSNASVQHASLGLTSNALGAALVVSDSTFQANNVGLRIAAGTPSLVGLQAIGNSTHGIQVTASGAPSITNCIAHSNGGNGFYVTRSGGGAASISLDKCTSHLNGGAGVRAESATGTSTTLTLKNSNVTQNTTGVYRDTSFGSTSVAVSYSNVWGNATNFVNASVGAGVFSANPLYVTSPTNVRLTSNSPSRFAGDTGGDLGAFPYAGDLTPGLHGTLWSNTTLTTAGSPYVVAGDVTVATAATLTVQPGVTLQFATSDVMAAGFDTSRAELRVLGKLSAVGNVSQPIYFTSSGSLAASWYGIELVSSLSGSSLASVKVDEAVRALYCDTSGAPTLQQLTLERSTFGLYAQSGTLYLDGAAISTCTSAGVFLAGTSNGTLNNVVAASNGGNGIHIQSGPAANSTWTVTNVTVHANAAVGIAVDAFSGSSATLNLRNAIVSQNGLYGVQRVNTAITTANVSYTDCWNNAVANYVNVSAGAGSISANPQFVSAPTNLRLQPTSVCIDAGTATTAPNHDLDGVLRPLDGDGILGPAFDMGAYEYALGGFAPYCTAGTSTSGCSASIAASGSPSIGATSGFVLSCSGVEAQKTCLFFYGTSGRKASLWTAGSTSWLCVRAPVQRTTSMNSGGLVTTCNGAVSFDLAAFLAAHPGALGQPFTPGVVCDAQLWYRDPSAPGTTNLSDAIEWTTVP